MARQNLIHKIASDRDAIKETIRLQNINNKELYSALATMTAGLSYSADNTGLTDYKFPRTVKSSYTGGTAVSTTIHDAVVLPPCIVTGIYALNTASLTDNGTAAGSFALYFGANAIWTAAAGDGFALSGLVTHSTSGTFPLRVTANSNVLLKTTGITTGVTGSVTFYTNYIPIS